jgi:hypothetical protein
MLARETLRGEVSRTRASNAAVTFHRTRFSRREEVGIVRRVHRARGVTTPQPVARNAAPSPAPTPRDALVMNRNLLSVECKAHATR